MTHNDLGPKDFLSYNVGPYRRQKTLSLYEDLVGSRVLFPFGCEGRPGEVSRVWLFPSGVKEDQLCWVL
ncbi:hypothetical protein Taro_053862 [Colocasia esculenta]|uniref:Uncharacterized protein n=1 Tax=Colocasia esculenta TaxID=4460 RepID=A0A843XM92_COLES|nr:hypothetical protein [Colocasia esculenta]